MLTKVAFIWLKKYSKNSNLVKYYNLKEQFDVSVFCLNMF